MKRRIVPLVLAIGCAGAALAGCENLKEYRRTSRDDDPAVKRALHKGETKDKDKADSDDDDPDTAYNPKGIFKATRLPGALSSEGADIERSLGVR